MASTTDIAICERTKRRSSFRPLKLLPAFAPALRGSFPSVLAVWSAGTRPKKTIDATETAKVHKNTGRLRRIVDSSGGVPGGIMDAATLLPTTDNPSAPTTPAH